MSLPYFSMFPSDFEAKTSHLTMAEDGAYNRLLRICWMTPGCSMPADEAWIMRRARAHSSEEQDAVKSVLSEFFNEENGRYSNARLTRVWNEANEAHEKRKKAGSKGGKAKSLIRKESSPSNAKAKLKQPEPEPDIEEESKASSSKAAADFDNLYGEYLEAHPNPVESKAGLAAWQALVDSGVDPSSVVAAARAYAEKAKTFSSERFVQQSDNFLDPDHGKWRDHIPKTRSKPTETEVLDFYENIIRKKGRSASVTVSQEMARRLVAADRVTVEQLSEIGIAI